ncbi:MAG: hypothetical protein PHV09_05690 [Bacteroidales bacterium]|nr:hypothetical protein [Bacteroidales bacterium]
MDGARYGIWTGDYLWDNFGLVLDKKKESDDYSSDSFVKMAATYFKPSAFPPSRSA